jgi:hypothetical protein
VLAQATRIKPFDRFDDSRVERAAPLLQKTPVSHFVSERMFERVFEIREQISLIEELRRL